MERESIGKMHIATDKLITDLQMEVNEGHNQNIPKQLQNRIEAIESSQTTQSSQIEYILQKLVERDAKDARDKRYEQAVCKRRGAVKDL